MGRVLVQYVLGQLLDGLNVSKLHLVDLPSGCLRVLTRPDNDIDNDNDNDNEGWSQHTEENKTRTWDGDSNGHECWKWLQYVDRLLVINPKVTATDGWRAWTLTKGIILVSLTASTDHFENVHGDSSNRLERQQWLQRDKFSIGNSSRWQPATCTPTMVEARELHSSYFATVTATGMATDNGCTHHTYVRRTRHNSQSPLWRIYTSMATVTNYNTQQTVGTINNIEWGSSSRQ